MDDPWKTVPEDLELRLRQHVQKAGRLNLEPSLLAKYARVHIAAEEIISHRAKGEQEVRDMQARVAASEHGIHEDDPKKARAGYAAACRIQQQVHASATGCSQRLTKLEGLLETRYSSLQVDVRDKFPLPGILAASQLIRDFAAATAPHGRWAEVKFAKSELSLTVSGHTFLWWWTRIPRYNGKWKDMYALARCWHMTDARDLDTFERVVRKQKPKPDSQGGTWILPCPPWALV